jgi:hypothetical protein
VKGFEFKDEIEVPASTRLIRPVRLVGFDENTLGIVGSGSNPVWFLAEDLGDDPVVADEITAEFFSRQLQDIDTRNTEQVVEFANTCGVAFSPFYDSVECFIASREKNISRRDKLIPFDRDDSAVIAICEEANDTVERFLCGDYQAPRAFYATQQTLAAQYYVRQVEALEDADGHVFECGGIVSLKEVTDTLRMLQNATLLASTVDALDDPIAIVDYLLSAQHRHQRGATYFLDKFAELYETETNITYWIGERAQWAYDFIRYCSAWANRQPEAMLTGLVATQFLSVFDDATTWHICENTSCGRIFKFHEGTNDKTRASRFCRVNCSKIQSRREALTGKKSREQK